MADDGYVQLVQELAPGLRRMLDLYAKAPGEWHNLSILFRLVNSEDGMALEIGSCCLTDRHRQENGTS
jgi:hypothetical protein